MKKFIAIEGLVLLLVVFLFLGLQVLIEYQSKESYRLFDALISREAVSCDTSYCLPKVLVMQINDKIAGLSIEAKRYRLKKLFGTGGLEIFSQLEKSVNRKDSLADFRWRYLWHLYLLYFAFRFIGWAVAVLSKKDE